MNSINQQHIDSIKLILFNKIISYFDHNGITISIQDLISNISISNNDLPTNKPTKPKIKFKPKPKTIKFKPKSKPKPKLTSYNDFIDICSTHNLNFFKYNDTHNWSGPATKILSINYESHIKFFHNFNFTTIKTIDFYIIHPNNNYDDSYINYPNYNDHIFNSSTISYTSDDDQIYNNTTDDEQHDIITEEWEYRNVIYLLDTYTNNVYSKQTMQFIGNKIDDYEIDFDAKE